MRAKLQHEDKFMHELRVKSHKLQNEALLFIHSPWRHTHTHSIYMPPRPVIPLVRDTFSNNTFKTTQWGTSLRWSVCDAEERQCAGLFLEVSHPRALQRCSAKRAVFRAGVGCSPSLPARSPSLAVPSSDCSSCGNTKKRRCIQEPTETSKNGLKTFCLWLAGMMGWCDWSIQVFKLTFRLKDNKQMTTLEDKKHSKSSIIHPGTCLHWTQHFCSSEYMKTRMIVQVRAVFIIMKMLPWGWDERQELALKSR